MIKDITIGQFFPGNSPVHRLDARAKILLTIVFIVMLFTAGDMRGLGVCAVFTLLTFLISRIPLKMMFKGLRTILVIINVGA